MENIKKIRHEIYHWLIEQGFDLTQERRQHLSSLIQQHSDGRAKNLKSATSLLQAQVEQDNKVKQKMRDYINKANTIKPMPEKVKVEMETLKKVLGWFKETSND